MLRYAENSFIVHFFLFAADWCSCFSRLLQEHQLLISSFGNIELFDKSKKWKAPYINSSSSTNGFHKRVLGFLTQISNYRRVRIECAAPFFRVALQSMRNSPAACLNYVRWWSETGMWHIDSMHAENDRKRKEAQLFNRGNFRKCILTWGGWWWCKQRKRT